MKRSTLKAQFRVYGTPRPGGSKCAFNHPKTGKPIVMESNPTGNRDWRNSVASAAMDFWGPQRGLIDGALTVKFEFLLSRPKGHYGSGRNSHELKTSSPASPTTRPDVLKLSRSTEDALTGILWADDAQIVREILVKRYALRGEPPGCVVSVWENDDRPAQPAAGRLFAEAAQGEQP